MDIYFDESDIFGTIAAVGMLLLVVLLVALAFGAAMYILTSYGMYKLAKRRGIKKPWLAWIPVASNWILGSISDQYQYLVKRKNTNRRMIVLILSAANTVIGGAFSGSYLSTMLSMCFDMSEVSEIIGAFAALLGIGMLVAALAITTIVFQMIALYDLYNSCSPNNSVLFLVLSILFNVTQPFFIFCCRNKDNGMPPRKTPCQDIPQQLPQGRVFNEENRQ